MSPFFMCTLGIFDLGHSNPTRDSVALLPGEHVAMFGDVIVCHGPGNRALLASSRWRSGMLSLQDHFCHRSPTRGWMLWNRDTPILTLACSPSQGCL